MGEHERQKAIEQEVQAMQTPVDGSTIFAGWVVSGNSEGDVTIGYGLDDDFWDEPPMRFAKRLDALLTGVMPRNALNRRMEPCGTRLPRPGTITYRSAPWFGVEEQVGRHPFGGDVYVARKSVWKRIYARPIATLTPAPRGGIE